MKTKELFELCVKKAIEIERPLLEEIYNDYPSIQELELAIVLFKEYLNGKLDDDLEYDK